MRKHKALLIGISDFNPAGIGGPDLKGSVNDVTDMYNTLQICGFSVEAIKVLKDRDASRMNILDGVSWLLSDTRPGDSLVLYYSGHGSYTFREMPDRSVVREQVIRPFEFSQEITVRDLMERFATLQTDVHLEIFMDCCHSGPAAEFLHLQKLDDRKMVPRFVRPLTALAAAGSETACESGLEVRRFFPEQLLLSPKLRHVLWAACGADQLSYESSFDAQMRGIFTYHLCSELKNTQGIISRSDLKARVTQAISDSRFDQVPQLQVDPADVRKTIFT
jgi:metacaspase-1